MIKVEIPDKKITVEFPDGTPQDEMMMLINRDVYGKEEQPVEETVTPLNETTDYPMHGMEGDINAPHATTEDMARIVGTLGLGLPAFPVSGLTGLAGLIGPQGQEDVGQGFPMEANISDYDRLGAAEKGMENVSRLTNFIKTPEQQKTVEELMQVLKPLEMAGAGWGGLAELATTGDLQKASDVIEGKSGGSSLLVPTLKTGGEASALFGLPKLLGRKKGVKIDEGKKTTPTVPEPEKVAPEPPTIATKAKEVVSEPKAKEPWEMTRGEFKQWMGDHWYEEADIPKGEAGVHLVTGEVAREQTIQRAIKEGKPVPPEVLKDYPDLKGKGLKSIESELGKEVDASIETPLASESGKISFGKGEKPKETPEFKFEDNKIETEFQHAQGVKPPSFKERFTERVTNLTHIATRHYRHLPRTEEFSDVRFALQKLGKQKGVSGDRTARAIQGIVSKLDKPKYDLFRRKVILDDLAETASESKNIPFFDDVEGLHNERARIDAEIGKNPEILEAIAKREKLWEGVRNEYTSSLKDIGFSVEKRFTRQNYFRHQVLEHARLEALAGTGKKLRTPTGRGFLKKRRGTDLAINTDYIQAEYDVLAKMLYDIEVAKTIKRIDKNYNIVTKLKKLAKEQGKDWRELIPKGYTSWQPREGHVFYLTDSVPESLTKELFSGELEEIGVGLEDLRKVLAMGKKFREFVVKDEIAKTIDELFTQTGTNIVSRASKKVLKAWKIWTLISPRRFFKYNVRNLSGDADAVFVGNPSSFKKLPQATKELFDVFVNNKSMTPEMKDWFERGGMQSTLQAQEMGEVSKLDIFKKLQDKNLDIKSVPLKAWKKYWRTARLATDFREATLRYASYLDYMEQMKASKSGLPKNFGGSLPEEIKGLSDIKDRAFWLSNDLLGAYDRVSVLGTALREHLYPFWSWKEINFKRYIRMYRNAIASDQLCETVGRHALKGIATTPYKAYRAGKFLVKATALWSMIQTWNWMRYPDEERSLPNDVRSRPHIIFGKDDEGNILYFSRLGALGDFLEWFGLDNAPEQVDAWFKGEKTAKEIAIDIAKSPLNVLMQGATPYFKWPAEMASRQSFYPDVFRPKVIRDMGLYLARSFGMEHEYRAIADIPSRPYKKSVGLLFAYRADPLQSAYSDTMEEKHRFLKSVGKESRGYWLSPRSNALYNMKMAVRYNDKKASKEYFNDYITLVNPRTPKEFKEAVNGIVTSLKRMEPLNGLNKEEKVKFIGTLNKDQRLKLTLAMKFYTQTLLGAKFRED